MEFLKHQRSLCNSLSTYILPTARKSGQLCLIPTWRMVAASPALCLRRDLCPLRHLTGSFYRFYLVTLVLTVQPNESMEHLTKSLQLFRLVQKLEIIELHTCLDFARAFSKARIAYYPNSLATYSLMRIALSGDVEPNPGMSINTGTKAKGDGERRPCIKIAHLNVRSIKKREHYFLARDLVKKYKLDISPSLSHG